MPGADPRWDAALSVIMRLRRAGHEALLVGGCVRDLLLGEQPNDYDVATSAHPEHVTALFPHHVAVGAKFGVLIVIEQGHPIEVATFRTESGYADRRRPDQVEFSDPQHDAQRRDFTMNGLFLDAVTHEIIDYVGGERDLRDRVLRTIGLPQERFSEDALRLLRAVRFASSMELEIEPQTLAAIQKLRDYITSVSPERIRDELMKGLTRAHPDRFVELLDETGLLEIVLPEVAATKGCEQPPEFHPEGDVFVHTVAMLRLLKADPSPVLAFATLLHDIGKPPTMEITDRIRFNNHHRVGAEMADEICRRLMFSNQDRESIVFMVARHMNFINLKAMKASTWKRFLSADTIEDELELHRVDCASSSNFLENYDLARERIEEMRAEAPLGKLPPPFITGRDLIGLGLSPGPIFKELLDCVQDAQLEGTIESPEQALQLVRSILKSKEKPRPEN